MDDLIEALQIFRKYGNPTNPTNCDRDLLAIDISPYLVTEADKNRLEELGFFDHEDDDDMFMSFRFGSC